MELSIITCLSQSFIYLGVLVIQALVVAVLLATVYSQPFHRATPLQRRAPMFLGTAVVALPLLAWMGVQFLWGSSIAAFPATVEALAPSPRPTGAQRTSAPWDAALTPTEELLTLGKKAVQEQNCFACHRIQGKGGVLAVDLSGVGRRRDAQWIYRHFQDPQAVSPGTFMPTFQLSDKELLALTAYMLTLRE